MGSTDGSGELADQIYTPSTGGGVYTAGHAHRDKPFRRRSTIKDKIADIETASVDEKDDGVEERDFQKQQVQRFILLFSPQ
jgi:KUP system potassium uptake protein